MPFGVEDSSLRTSERYPGMSYWGPPTALENKAVRIKGVQEARTGRYISLEDCEDAILIRANPHYKAK